MVQLQGGQVLLMMYIISVVWHWTRFPLWFFYVNLDVNKKRWKETNMYIENHLSAKRFVFLRCFWSVLKKTWCTWGHRNNFIVLGLTKIHLFFPLWVGKQIYVTDQHLPRHNIPNIPRNENNSQKRAFFISLMFTAGVDVVLNLRAVVSCWNNYFFSWITTTSNITYTATFWWHQTAELLGFQACHVHPVICLSSLNLLAFFFFCKFDYEIGTYTSLLLRNSSLMLCCLYRQLF